MYCLSMRSKMIRRSIRIFAKITIIIPNLAHMHGFYETIKSISSFSTPSSSKLGLAAGSSALSPPEMLFRTWGGGQGGHCTQRTRPRGVGADCQTVSTSQPDLSRLKTLTPSTSSTKLSTHLLNTIKGDKQ